MQQGCYLLSISGTYPSSPLCMAIGAERRRFKSGRPLTPILLFTDFGPFGHQRSGPSGVSERANPTDPSGAELLASALGLFIPLTLIM